MCDAPDLVEQGEEAGPVLLTWSLSDPRAFVAGGIAACGAVTVTHSFETVKIRYFALAVTRAKSPGG